MYMLFQGNETINDLLDTNKYKPFYVYQRLVLLVLSNTLSPHRKQQSYKALIFKQNCTYDIVRKILWFQNK